MSFVKEASSIWGPNNRRFLNSPTPAKKDSWQSGSRREQRTKKKEVNFHSRILEGKVAELLDLLLNENRKWAWAKERETEIQNLKSFLSSSQLNAARKLYL